MVKENETRSEEEKVCQAPLTVILGGEEYLLVPLVIRDSREWRKKLVDLLAPLPGILETSSDKPEEFNDAIRLLLMSMPDTVIELFFDYAKNLNREEIEGKATEAEIQRAFEQVLEVAFPLSSGLAGTMSRIAR